MNIRKIIFNMLALLIIAQHGMVISMDNGNNAPVENQDNKKPKIQLTPEELANVHAAAQDVLNSVKDLNIDIDYKKIVADAKANEQRRRDEARQNELDTIKWQNTILLEQPGVPVAIYNKDLVTASALVVNLIAINALNNHLHECRVNQILASLTKDPAQWIALFEEVREEKEKLDAEWLEKDIFQKLASKFQKTPYEKQQELDTLLAKEHNFIQRNPFKSELATPLFTTFAVQNITAYAEDQFLAKNACDWSVFHAFRKGKDADGNDILREDQESFFPLSATSVAKWWLFPDLATEWGDCQTTIAKKIPGLSIEAYYEQFLIDTIGVPKKWYDRLHWPIVNFIMQIFSLGLGAKMMNDMYQTRWCIQVAEKRDQLIELLHTYAQVKALPDERAEKQAALTDLKQFIIEGNSINTLSKLNSWPTFTKHALGTLAFYRSLPILAIVAWNWRKVVDQLKGFIGG